MSISRNKIVLLALALSLLFFSPAAAQQITLLHINDTHSHLDAWGPKDGNLDGTLGGLARAATLIAAAKAADPQALFVHAGDFMDGDFFFNEYLGVPELQMLKAIGLDALVLGNHEFVFGEGVLAGVLQAAWGGAANGVTILATNLSIPDGNALKPWVTPTAIKTVNGVKVGLFGLTPPGAAMENPEEVEILDEVIVLSQAAVDSLLAGGAQVVVCLSHQGLDAARELAAGVSGIDVIVSGHDHVALEQPEAVERQGGGTTWVLSAGSRYRWVGRLGLSVAGGQVKLTDYTLLSVDAGVSPSPLIESTIDGLKAGIVAQYGDVYHQRLARAKGDIAMDWDPDKAKRDTPLGNLFTDAYRAWTGTDIAVEPFGYMGDPIPEGPVVGADIFRAMSYGSYKTSPRVFARPWRLATYTMTGADLITVLEILLYYGDDFFPQVSGLRFQYDSTAPFGHKVLLDTVEVNGQPLDAGRSYSFTATEQVYGALAFVLQVPAEIIAILPTYAFDAVRSYVTAHHELVLGTSGRIRDVAVVHGVGKAQAAVRR
jgi:5'-nucleotidase/UDP-sugar diphosphatase